MATRTRELLNLPPTARDFFATLFWGYTNGAPVDGVTGAGEAGPGCMLADILNKEVYKNTGTLASPTWNPLGGVVAGEIVLATGSILVGSSGVAAALNAKGDGKILVGNGTTITSVSVSGDATLANTGALTIAAGAIDPAMLADGALSADATGRAKIASDFFDATTADTAFAAGAIGEDLLTAAEVTGRAMAVVANGNVVGGIPVVHTVTIATGTADTTVVLTHKTRFFEVIVAKTSTAGGAADTVTIKNVATAITDAMSLNVADKTVVRAGTIDDAQATVAAGANLVVSAVQGTTDCACEVTLLGYRIA